jgi:hypothetical protein
MIILGGWNRWDFNQVEKYNIQTGDCLPLPFSSLDHKKCICKVHIIQKGLSLPKIMTHEFFLSEDYLQF